MTEQHSAPDPSMVEAQVAAEAQFIAETEGEPTAYTPGPTDSLADVPGVVPMPPDLLPDIQQHYERGEPTSRAHVAWMMNEIIQLRNVVYKLTMQAFDPQAPDVRQPDGS